VEFQSEKGKFKSNLAEDHAIRSCATLSRNSEISPCGVSGAEHRVKALYQEPAGSTDTRLFSHSSIQTETLANYAARIARRARK
jgi:hypothetical protein